MLSESPDSSALTDLDAEVLICHSSRPLQPTPALDVASNRASGDPIAEGVSAACPPSVSAPIGAICGSPDSAPAVSPSGPLADSSPAPAIPQPACALAPVDFDPDPEGTLAIAHDVLKAVESDPDAYPPEAIRAAHDYISLAANPDPATGPAPVIADTS